MNKTETKRKNRFNKRRNYKSSKRRSFKKTEKIDINKYINKQVESKPQSKYESDHTFEDFGLHPELIKRISVKGYKIPSEIQDKSIPFSLKGKDVIGIAGTGTGKTAAFLIPIINQLLENKRNHFALIISPTRELANQINDEFRSLTKGLGLFSTCLIGGASVGDSIRALKKVNHLIIGTPGRMIDMMERKALKLQGFKVLILDEFDRMLDMGFSKDMEKIADHMINRSQTLLFSATLDPSQQALIDKFTFEPVSVKASSSTKRTQSIDQDVMHVGNGNRFKIVHELVQKEKGQKTILFCETKRKADELKDKMRKENIATDVIHGDKTQRAREVALRKFRTGKIHLLIATDVLARGIDVPNVELVINYEAPQNYTDYIHRIGRTGRAGKAGRAITLID